MLIITLFAILYINVNIIQTSYNSYLRKIPMVKFISNFTAIFISNSIIGSLRIVSSNLLSYFFIDMATKWKHCLSKKAVVSANNTIARCSLAAVNDSFNCQKLKHSVSYDSFFSIKTVNEIGEKVTSINNKPKPNSIII